MKKSIIAGAGVAALGFAALPFAGVFATTGNDEFTDSLSVTVGGGCTLENGNTTDGTYVDRSFSANIATGTYQVLAGANANSNATITIKCNTSSGTVTVKATPANSGNLIGTEDNTKTIAPGAVVAGSTSGWAIKSNASGATSDPWAGSGSAVSEAGYYVAAPTSEQTFLSGTASTNGITFNPSYRTYVAAGQTPDTYTGSVTYKVSYQQ